MQKSIEYKGYVVRADSYQWTGSIWDAHYWIEVQQSGEHVREVVHAAFRETSDSACNAALVRGLQYVDLALPEVSH
jgi:hypothetical protein